MKKKMYKNKEKCCGCGSCEQICPKHAIVMKEDNEGFLYPYVDYEKCNNCRLCEKKCPIGDYENKTDNIRQCYLAYDKNIDNRINSSSGGVFSLLAKRILTNHGIVSGASFDEHWNVHHICIDNDYKLHMLMGSKYLQSRMENIYNEIEYYLKEGRTVLFSGVECQISGLKHFLGREYNNLYTVGVLCHGVPSSRVWHMYLDWQKELNNSSIKKISFRNKDYGWKKYNVKIEFENGNIYSKVFYDDSYMKLFLENICLRPSCYECQHKKLERDADISIGDCWGVENTVPDMDDDLGTSVVLIHSEKGKQLFDSIKEYINHKESVVDEVLPKYADSRHSVDKHVNRRKFFKEINKSKGIGNLLKCLDLSYLDRLKRKVVFIKRKINDE